jgi:hypothetical protein
MKYNGYDEKKKQIMMFALSKINLRNDNLANVGRNLTLAGTG